MGLGVQDENERFMWVEFEVHCRKQMNLANVKVHQDGVISMAL